MNLTSSADRRLQSKGYDTKRTNKIFSPFIYAVTIIILLSQQGLEAKRNRGLKSSSPDDDSGHNIIIITPVSQETGGSNDDSAKSSVPHDPLTLNQQQHPLPFFPHEVSSSSMHFRHPLLRRQISCLIMGCITIFLCFLRIFSLMQLFPGSIIK